MNKFKLAMFTCLFLVLVLFPVLSGCAAPAPEAKTIRIGAFVSLTGPGSETETRAWQAQQLARDWINNRGGVTIKGEKYLIELVAADAKGSAEGSIAAATKLVEEDKVKFIIGGIPPFMIIAYGTVTEPAKVLRAIAMAGGIPEEMNANTKYTFRTDVGLMDGVGGIYQYLVEGYPNVKTVAMVMPDDAAAPFVFAAHEKAANSLGLKVVGKEVYPWGTVDYYPVATKLLASKPDAIAQGGGFGMMAGGILKSARELGFKGPIFVGSPVPILEVLDVVGKDLGTDFFCLSPNPLSPNLPPMVKEILKLTEGKTTATLTELLGAWDGVWCMVQAIEKAQSLDTTEVAKVWEQMEKIETSRGTGKMGGLKTYGVNHVVVKPIPISRLMNGEAQDVKWFLPEIP